MNTALLISGLPRAVSKSFPSIRDAIIVPNNPDIFVHTWGDPNNQSLRNEICNLFNPTAITIEPQKNIVNDHINLDRMMASHGRGYSRPCFVEMVYSMWYSLLQSNLLKEEHRLKNNIHYDCVIRIRFDINYRIVVNVSDYDLNVINIAKRDLPSEMVDDQFAFASNELMNMYCGGFSWMEYVFSKRDKLDGIFCSETLLYEMFKSLEIKYNVINGLDTWKVFG